MARKSPSATDAGSLRPSGHCRRPWIAPVVIAAVVGCLFSLYLVTELGRNHEPGFPLDDPWIHLTFARNLARGWGFAYNISEPVAGSTAPLWTLILALSQLFVGNPAAMVIVAKVLGMVFLSVAAIYASRIAVQLSGNGWAGLAAGLTAATLWPMGWAMMSGMEVTLSTAVTLAAVYYYLKLRAGWEVCIPWALFGVAAFTRPECLLLAGLASLDALLQKLVLRRRVTYWRGLLAYVPAVALYFALNLALSGSPFPQTYLAKASSQSLLTALSSGSMAQVTGLLSSASASYFTEFAGFLWRTNPILVLLVPAGVVAVIVRAARGDSRAGFLVPLVALGYVPLIGAIAPTMGPAFQTGRYVGNALALAAVTAVVAGTFIVRAISSRPARTVAAVAMVTLATFNAIASQAASIRNTARAESSINRMQVALGRWLAANTPDSAVLACNDVGAIGYLSGRRVIDLVGLVTKDAVNWRRQHGDYRSYLQRKRPDYLVIFPVEFPELKDAPYLTPVGYSDLSDNTASQFDFRPRARTVAGLVLLDLVVEPMRSVMVAFKYDAATLPATGTTPQHAVPIARGRP